ncbi:MAG TPA: NlpC/P60 family protein [Acidimicrobiia bacterium]|nr:NlpC/P60 family protein [Acidimicrobiia bacterium]
MGLEGITALRARIAQIQQLGSAPAAPAASTNASRTANLATELTAAGAETNNFASMLQNALGTQATPGNDLSTMLQNALGTQATPGNDLSSMLQNVLGTRPATTTGNAAKAQDFLQIALQQKGKPYVYGAHTQPTDADPPAFDCSELTKWAAAQSGITIPDGATAQYLQLRDQGRTMSVEEALRTPGALLFHFGYEPKDLGDIPADGHVAISMGDGKHTIEARGRKYGTGIFDATGERAGFFNRAGMIAGM